MSANDVRPLVDVHGTRVWKRFFSSCLMLSRKSFSSAFIW